MVRQTVDAIKINVVYFWAFAITGELGDTIRSLGEGERCEQLRNLPDKACLYRHINTTNGNRSVVRA